MFETMQAGVEAGVGADEFVAFCQSPEARKCWPGAGSVESQEGGFVYRIDMYAPGAPVGELLVEEHMRAPERDEDGISLEAGLLWFWPTGELSSSWMTYRFVEEAGRTRLDFSLRYLLPGRAVGRLINRVRFARTMDRAVQRYLTCLAQSAGGAGSAA